MDTPDQRQDTITEQSTIDAHASTIMLTFTDPKMTQQDVHAFLKKQDMHLTLKAIDQLIHTSALVRFETSEASLIAIFEYLVEKNQQDLMISFLNHSPKTTNKAAYVLWHANLIDRMPSIQRKCFFKRIVEESDPYLLYTLSYRTYTNYLKGEAGGLDDRAVDFLRDIIQTHNEIRNEHAWMVSFHYKQTLEEQGGDEETDRRFHAIMQAGDIVSDIQKMIQPTENTNPPVNPIRKMLEFYGLAEKTQTQLQSIEQLVQAGFPWRPLLENGILSVENQHALRKIPSVRRALLQDLSHLTPISTATNTHNRSRKL